MQYVPMLEMDRTSKSLSRTWMSHVTDMNESWHTYEGGLSPRWMCQSRTRMSHVPLMSESCHTCDTDATLEFWRLCHTYEWVTSRHTYEWVTSRHTYEWVTSRHVTHMNESRHATRMNESVVRMNESCHTYEWLMSHAWHRCHGTTE